MWEAAGSALVALLDPFRMMMLLLGLLAGGVIGMLPGLAGIGAVSILLPFVLKLDPLSGLAMLLRRLRRGLYSSGHHRRRSVRHADVGVVRPHRDRSCRHGATRRGWPGARRRIPGVHDRRADRRGRADAREIPGGCNASVIFVSARRNR